MGELGSKFEKLTKGRASITDDAAKDTDIGVRPKAKPVGSPEPTQTNTPMLKDESFKAYGKRLADLQDTWNQNK